MGQSVNSGQNLLFGRNWLFQFRNPTSLILPSTLGSMYHDQFPVINIASSPNHKPSCCSTVSPTADCQLPPGQLANLNSCTTAAASSLSPSSSPPAPAMDQSPSKTRVAISNLMSPPELKPHDNFTHSDDTASASTTTPQTEGKGKGKTKPMISPPESPGIARLSIIPAPLR